ncbi:hypothetical protein [Amycolatopsis sp. NPDC059021]|uniref:hypothetical protein n=1 Tax=Amycolatopsis sp. NPDC059021 TaxID=3346704 RepID=UPI00366E00D4
MSPRDRVSAGVLFFCALFFAFGAFVGAMAAKEESSGSGEDAGASASQDLWDDPAVWWVVAVIFFVIGVISSVAASTTVVREGEAGESEAPQAPAEDDAVAGQALGRDVEELRRRRSSTG